MGDDERLAADVDDDEEVGGSEEAPSGLATSRIVKILLWVVGIVLLGASMFGISWIVANYVEERRSQREEGILVAPPPAPREHFDLPAFSVSTRDEEPHFAKITVSLGYEENPELMLELGKRRVEIRHVINMLLSSKKYEDMDSLEDKIGLAEEIKSHVNVILSSGKIVDVYFTEFVVNY
ncbi:MAG TPA: flagellar basal body-associated FliL family protein [Spirochaetota bacterium]|nr:flagellar basal body-associated FliL family protein [Spirochaetota bacterium]HPJ39824.1 flagellar basal body-associated FliL family protein [Spirochaetota bacterium]HPQ54984.1 flagellar basal body-associated FliL family protein [Spirochaetota bacterium]